WGREGSSRVREAPVADPALIRRLGVGQAAYIYRGGVTFVQVKRLVAAPAALATAPWPGQPPGSAAAAAGGGQARAAWPEGPPAVPHPAGAPAGHTAPPAPAPADDVAALLDEAFGREQG